MTGKVYLIGAGPGDPELLTLKGARLLQRADYVLYDRLVSNEVLEFINPAARRHYCGKRAHDHSMEQHTINQRLVDAVKEYDCVVRLKGGDPFIFGRGGEEARALADAGVCFEVVPGITAAQGCSASARIPLTHRGLSSGVQYLTGHRMRTATACQDEALHIDPSQTQVIYMGLETVARTVDVMLQHGRLPDTPAAIVQNGSRNNQRCVITTLARLPEDVKRFAIRAPALLIIGNVVSLSRAFDHRQAGIASSREFQPVQAVDSVTTLHTGAFSHAPA